MTDLDDLEQQLTDARDALIAYWEQEEGQACFFALTVVDAALDAYRAVEGMRREGADWARMRALAAEVAQLRAPIAGVI